MSVINRVLREMPPVDAQAQQLPGVRAVPAPAKRSAYRWWLAAAALPILWYIWTPTEQHPAATAIATDAATSTAITSAPVKANGESVSTKSVGADAGISAPEVVVREHAEKNASVPASDTAGSTANYAETTNTPHASEQATSVRSSGLPLAEPSPAANKNGSSAGNAVASAPPQPAALTANASVADRQTAAHAFATQSAEAHLPASDSIASKSATEQSADAQSVPSGVHANAQSRLLQQLQAQGVAAIPELEQRLREQAHQPALRKLLGQLLLRQQQAARARYWLSEHTPALTQDADWHALLALAELHSGDAGAAALRYQQLIRLEPHQGRHHAGLALALEQLLQFSAARDSYRLALQDPDLDPAMRQWALQRLQTPNSEPQISESARPKTATSPTVSSESGRSGSASSDSRSSASRTHES